MIRLEQFIIMELGLVAPRHLIAIMSEFHAFSKPTMQPTANIKRFQGMIFQKIRTSESSEMLWLGDDIFNQNLLEYLQHDTSLFWVNSKGDISPTNTNYIPM